MSEEVLDCVVIEVFEDLPFEPRPLGLRSLNCYSGLVGFEVEEYFVKI